MLAALTADFPALSLGVHSALQDVTHSLAISRYGNSLAPLRCFAARDRRRTRTFSVDAEIRRAGAALEWHRARAALRRHDGRAEYRAGGTSSAPRSQLVALSNGGRMPREARPAILDTLNRLLGHPVAGSQTKPDAILLQPHLGTLD